ncbi:DNA-binding MarR family transcriptional regulator [Motilibacter peucedani]|uniref:DNA-binding MarR family transcriptional regulator n=1 Tax=Motilibacter peucedani TaxID=598650 RepID=A0A420XTA6_9ACTN|nr:MarR family transcriptional regulator [Motilibacter peucedani]RKS80092.1 DNA-binding MarR family transcriptional regulator [Motilibacter peucedani]
MTSQTAPTGPEPRWLSADEQHVWRTFLDAMTGLFDELDRQLQAEAGIPHAYYEILVHLSEAPGRRLRMSELADRLTSSRSRLSHAVSRLEERGWIRREACPSDRRGQEAVLTDLGFESLAAAAPGHVAAVRRYLVDALSPEDYAALGRISTALRAARGAETPPAGCPGAA